MVDLGMLWRRYLIHAAAWGLCVWGCGSDGTSRHAMDAGKDSSNPDGSGGAGGGSATGGQSGAPPCTMDASTDGATADSSDTSPTGSTPDAGAPPTYCVAPCIWDLMKKCSPEGACVTQSLPPPTQFPSYQSVSCAPENGWWKTTLGHDFYDYDTSINVYLHGAFCYGYALVCMCNPGMTEFSQWRDAEGRVVAYGGGPDAPVSCVTPSGDVSYPQDPTNPACAAWQSQCTEAGCCGTPPEPPQSNVGWFLPSPDR